MPYVNIKVTNEGVTRQQKQRLVSGVNHLLKEVLNKDPKSTFVIIDEVELDNWGIGFDLVSDIRKSLD
ncbi:4-oxalocrotonate tautomerase family protein [Agaribacter marinus]|uniref:Tautomerase n=1 Tax=Agaribacter marinus TaxID=1431249 RepID=A0AA37SUA1_9ALTE|nr:4-oxalocrotonate tautomerase family protein [Agaribacter marinus]GLR69262.1 tautomerase [Agaribacter marinus]